MSSSQLHVRLQSGLAVWRRQIVNYRGRSAFQIRENLFDLTGKRQLRVESRPVQVAAGELKFTQHIERCSHPAGAAVVTPNLVSTARLLFEQDDGGAFVRSLRY